MPCITAPNAAAHALHDTSMLVWPAVCLQRAGGAADMLPKQNTL
jgi:hypothetical protein